MPACSGAAAAGLCGRQRPPVISLEGSSSLSMYSLREGLLTLLTLLMSALFSSTLMILVTCGWARLVRILMSLVHTPAGRRGRRRGIKGMLEEHSSRKSARGGAAVLRCVLLVHVLHLGCGAVLQTLKVPVARGLADCSHGSARVLAARMHSWPWG